MSAKVLILGGGSGGLVTANSLHHIFKNKSVKPEITLIDKNKYHEFMPSYPWVALGYRDPDEIRRPLSLLEKKGIKYVNAVIEAIDPNKQIVKTSEGIFEYDFLVVSLGAELNIEGIEHYKEEAHHPWSLQGAMNLRRALKEFRGGNIVIGVQGMYYRCPPAPFEIAGQLDFMLRAKGIRDDTEITIFHLTPGPLSNMGPAISTVIAEILSNKGVRFVGNFEFDHISPEEKKVYAKDRRSLQYDLLIMPPAHKPNSVVVNSPLSNGKDFPVIDPETFRHVTYSNVFIIGDIVNPAINLPPAGVVAHFQAEFVANQIAVEIIGGYVGESFTPVAMCIMDFGDDAVLPMCEFTKVYKDLSGPPTCGVLGRGKEIRLVKEAFEAMWFANYLTK